MYNSCFPFTSVTIISRRWVCVDLGFSTIVWTKPLVTTVTCSRSTSQNKTPVFITRCATIVCRNVSNRSGTVSAGLLFPAGLWSGLSLTASGIDCVCLRERQSSRKHAEWSISTVEPRHVCSRSATHAGRLEKKNKTVADGTNKPACVFVTVTWCWCLVENAGDTAAQTKLTLNLKLWLWEGFPCYFPEYCSSILYVVQFHLLNNCQGF